MAKRAFFVTGTDTEVGKTTVSLALLHEAARRGLSTLALKPVAAGCEHVDGHWQNDDALQLQTAATEKLVYKQVNPIALPQAIAPHLAAKMNGIEIRAGDVAQHCQAQLSRSVDFALVEGAGGWLVPLNETENFADVASMLNVPVLLVVAIRLGCLNHALLSADAIARRGLTVAGWIANLVDENDPVAMANVETLRGRLASPCLGVLPRLTSPFAIETLASYLQMDTLLTHTS